MSASGPFGHLFIRHFDRTGLVDLRDVLVPDPCSQRRIGTFQVLADPKTSGGSVVVEFYEVVWHLIR